MTTNPKLPQSVLFVCTLNSIRSPMAEALMKKQFGQDIYIQSCGISTGELNQLMVNILSEVGIDKSKHISRSLEEISDTSFDLVIAFTKDAGEAAKAIFDDSDTEIEVWPLPDPTEGAHDVRAMMNNYRSLRENIDMRLKRRFSAAENT
ncbi:MAG: low molecular weight phosphatase family protein [Hyphomonadaceae bacterium]|nr:low molecular weight phosphatase family protein [Hyphomonadaceae bacterium]